MRRLTLLPLAMLAVLLAATPVAADSTYQTERLLLKDADGGVFGMVVNAHPNGPQIYAHEQYLLTGAEPKATYSVYLLLTPYNRATFADDCKTLRESPAGSGVPTSSITTNARGNGAANYVFTTAFVDAAGLHGMTFTAMWQVVNEDGEVAYETDCTVIALD